MKPLIAVTTGAKKPLSTLITLITILLVASCGSSSDSSDNSSTITPTTTPSPEISTPKKPTTDFDFYQSEAEVLAERALILTSRFGFGHDFYTISQSTHLTSTFSEDSSKWTTFFTLKLSSAIDEQVFLFIPAPAEFNQGNAQHDTCTMLNQKFTKLASFKCADQIASAIENGEEGDFIFLQFTSEQDNSPISFEFYVEALTHELGSTGFSRQESPAGDVEIVTENVFSPFYEEEIPSDLGATSYYELKTLLSELPSNASKTLVFNNFIGGSVDDDVNMLTGLLINSYELDTKISKTGRVFSGGTDLFSAGKNRIVELADSSKSLAENKQIGVHSWGEDNGDKITTALDIPFTNDSHIAQATYFYRVLGKATGVDFYLFTLTSAPFDGEYYLTEADSEKYNLITQMIKTNH